MRKTIEEFTREKEMDYLDRITQMNASTTAARKRRELALKYLENKGDSGRFGRIEELLSTTSKSGKQRVGGQGRLDTAIRWRNEDNKVTFRMVEVKTNGGRIEELIKRLEDGKDTLFIYDLNICNSTTKFKERRVEPVIMYFSLFYKMLMSINGIKSTNGKNPERAIQVSKIDLYNRLLEYPIPYENDTTYEESDFEGLEL